MVHADGEPVRKGYIIFIPAGEGRPVGAPIVGGRYELRASPGGQKVEIRATRATGTVDGNLGQPVEENFLPEEYNAQTKLTADVRAGGPNRIDFTLTSR
jgi:hypothetical protein